MMMNKKLLNLGCGNNYHKDWTNVDFFPEDKNVISTNLLNGIPFPDATFDVVYHSHVLEHFTKKDAVAFINECYRVLKSGGIIRVVLPDLAGIIKEYVRILSELENGKKELEADYDWIILELFDQMVRNTGGGDMGKYLSQKTMTNETYVFSRIGDGFRGYREFFLNKEKGTIEKKNIFEKKFSLKKLSNWVKSRLPFKEFRIGHFRLSGEIHQWMYDSYSLGRLLQTSGFKKPEVMEAHTSNIKDWNSYELDIQNGKVHAPASLFMEAIKP